ncbi:MAG: hypothetical protein AUJ49_07815 [Desulfovibrionaceae bacterium CG1_02_65_16]|nr:MAG: hypothetical protein AUJ49_07815 [Desulfovibrionaceae bacterium CG1_02_65_16]
MDDYDGYLGEIRMFAGTYAPEGWAFCDGSSLDRDSYQALFALIGVTYGFNSKTTFKLPDLRGRVPVHTGAGHGLTPRSCGNSFGQEQVELLEENITSHTHRILLSADTTATSASPNGNYLANSVNFNMYLKPAAGSNTMLNSETLPVGKRAADPHQNMMPCQCINYIIALEGYYPAQEGE